MAYTRSFIQRISDAAGARISYLGEALGVDQLVYNRLTFQSFHRVAKYSAPGVVRTFQALFPAARRYLDVGAGSGAYAAQFARVPGLSCLACERSRLGRKLAAQQGIHCLDFDLNRDPPAKLNSQFDIAYCFEVAEHLSPRLGDRLVQFLASCAPSVVFTAAAPGQIGMGHINCQPQEYWIGRFADCGMVFHRAMSTRASELFRAEDVAYWLIQNVMVFEHRT